MRAVLCCEREGGEPSRIDLHTGRGVVIASLDAAEGAGVQEPRYCSYLLRCWEERPANEGQLNVWRYSLEEPGTGRRHGFASLVALVGFLEGRALSQNTGEKQARVQTHHPQEHAANGPDSDRTG